MRNNEPKRLRSSRRGFLGQMLAATGTAIAAQALVKSEADDKAITAHNGIVASAQQVAQEGRNLNISLPQNDSNINKRDEYLTRNQAAYQYDFEYLPPLVVMKEIPKVEEYSAQYIAERISATGKLDPNEVAANKSFLDTLNSLQDYEDFFTLLPLPEVAKVYQTNTSFAEQRLSGANPLDLSNNQAETLENHAKNLISGDVYW